MRRNNEKIDSSTLSNINSIYYFILRVAMGTSAFRHCWLPSRQQNNSLRFRRCFMTRISATTSGAALAATLVRLLFWRPRAGEKKPYEYG